MTDHEPCDPADPCSTAYDLAGDRIDTLASEILGAHCACYAEAWPAHTCANECDAVAKKIRAAIGAWIPERDWQLSETKDRLAAALAQVARLRKATLHAAAWFDAMANNPWLEGRENIARQLTRVCHTALAETADTPVATPPPAKSWVDMCPDDLPRHHPGHIEVDDKPSPPASDGWTAWEGGECPVAPETLVEIRFWDGEINGPYKADEWDWDRLFRVADIVAYRIVEARNA